LALLSRRTFVGEPLSLADIAAWCGCSKTTIYKIEQAALKKIRAAVNDLPFASDDAPL